MIGWQVEYFNTRFACKFRNTTTGNEVSTKGEVHVPDQSLQYRGHAIS